MTVFANRWYDDHEAVWFVRDPAANLRAILAVHDSHPFGLAGGGLRMRRYACERAAIDDALRLSRAMTFKLALADLPAGGGKMIVMGDPSTEKTPALLHAVGRAIQRLGGRFVVGSDSGTDELDLAIVAEETAYVTRFPAGISSAASTAYGVALSIGWALERRLGRGDLDGVRVAIQGAGHVGWELARRLAGAGAELVLSDLDPGRAERAARDLGAEIVAPDAILDVDAEVFAPCALGDVIDRDAVSRLRCAIVAGSANEPLTDEGLASALDARGILFVPDFVANLGGVLGAAPPSFEGDAESLRRIERIASVLDEVAARATREGVPLQRAARELATERIAARRAR